MTSAWYFPAKITTTTFLLRSRRSSQMPLYSFSLKEIQNRFKHILVPKSLTLCTTHPPSWYPRLRKYFIDALISYSNQFADVIWRNLVMIVSCDICRQWTPVLPSIVNVIFLDAALATYWKLYQFLSNVMLSIYYLGGNPPSVPPPKSVIKLKWRKDKLSALSRYET